MQFRVRCQTLIGDIWWADAYGDNWGWFSETILLVDQLCTASGASPGFGRGGPRYFFQIWKFACREAMRFARGVQGHAPRENFLKWCNLVRFGVYFDQILSLKKFKNYHFLYKKLQFYYKRINILDTRLLWSNNHSREEIFWKIYDWCVLVCILK